MARNIPASLRQQVLLEGGYKCGNPTCRNVLALELHHIMWVRDGGPNTADNLIALCGHCHDLHTQGHISADAIVAWKGLLVSLNNPNRTLVDILLVLYDEEIRVAAEEKAKSENPADRAGVTPPFRFTGDGLSFLAPLMTSGLVEVSRRFLGAGYFGASMPSFQVALTERGRSLVEAWRKGDTDQIRRVLGSPRDG